MAAPTRDPWNYVYLQLFCAVVFVASIAGSLYAGLSVIHILFPFGSWGAMVAFTYGSIQLREREEADLGAAVMTIQIFGVVCLAAGLSLVGFFFFKQKEAIDFAQLAPLLLETGLSLVVSGGCMIALKTVDSQFYPDTAGSSAGGVGSSAAALDPALASAVRDLRVEVEQARVAVKAFHDGALEGAKAMEGAGRVVEACEKFLASTSPATSSPTARTVVMGRP